MTWEHSSMRTAVSRLLLGGEDTGNVTIEHRLANLLLFVLSSSFFCPFVLYSFMLTVPSSKPRQSLEVLQYVSI